MILSVPSLHKCPPSEGMESEHFLCLWRFSTDALWVKLFISFFHSLILKFDSLIEKLNETYCRFSRNIFGNVCWIDVARFKEIATWNPSSNNSRETVSAKASRHHQKLSLRSTERIKREQRERGREREIFSQNEKSIEDSVTARAIISGAGSRRSFLPFVGPYRGGYSVMGLYMYGRLPFLAYARASLLQLYLYFYLMYIQMCV